MAGTPKSKGKGGGKAPGTPKSAFSGGKFKKSADFLKGMKKDNRHLLFWQSLQQGIMVGWFQMGNKEEEAFVGPYLKMLQDNPELMEQLGVDAIVYRKGPDGEPMPQNPGTDYNWRQLVFIIGEEENTAEHREGLANGVIANFNLHATVTLFRYPRNVKSGGDITANPIPAVGVSLLDKDVIGLLMAAYPYTALDELKGFDEVMTSFWDEPTHGAGVMDDFINGPSGPSDA